MPLLSLFHVARNLTSHLFRVPEESKRQPARDSRKSHPISKLTGP